MQKARSHPTSGLLQLVGARFQVLFHSLIQGSFHLSFAVLVHYRSLYVFSLNGWFRLFPTGFLMSRGTQDTAMLKKHSKYRAITVFGLPFQVILLYFFIQQRSPTTPILPKQYWFGLFPVRSPLLRESLLFSFPPGT